MKKFSILLAIFILTLCLSANRSFAQEEEEQFLIVKLIIKKEFLEHTLKVPIKNSFAERPLIGGEFAKDHCDIDCPLTSEYGFYAFAENLDKNKARVSVTAKFRGKSSCNLEDKIFIVSTNKKTKLELECDVRIVAYYEKKNKTD